MTKGMTKRTTTPTRVYPSECLPLLGGSPTQPSYFPQRSPCPMGGPSPCLIPSLLPPVVDGIPAA